MFVGHNNYYCDEIVEDEIHFIFKCPVYNTYRDNLFDNIQNFTEFDVMSDCAKLNYLCKNFPKQISKYICHAFEMRQSLLYN